MDECNLSSNSSLPLATRWENIPETILINGMIGLTLFIIFLILTVIAWKRSDSDPRTPDLVFFLYGYRDPERWYVIPRYEFLRKNSKRHQHELSCSKIYVPPKLPLANPIELFEYNSIDEAKSIDENKPVQLKTIAKPTSPKATKLDSSFFYPSILNAEQREASYLSRKLNRFFSIFYHATDADIIYAKGIDAYEYLLFQRHLILIMLITTLFCIIIILPLHWFAGYRDTEGSSFRRSTIKNMSSSSIFYWSHIISSIFIVLLTMPILKSYRDSLSGTNESQLSRRTLLIGNLSLFQRDRSRLVQIFKDNFPKSHVESIQFVYDTGSLENYQSRLEVNLAAKEYCQYRQEKFNQDVMVKETDVNEGDYCGGYCRLCSFLYVCCCYWPKQSRQPGLTFYSKKEQELKTRITSALEELVKNPSEYAFVTFASHKQAKGVMERLSKMKAAALSEKSSSEKNNVQKSEETRDKSDDPLDPQQNPHIRSIRSPTRTKLSLDPIKSNLEGPVAWSVRYAPQPDNVEYYDLLNLTTTSKHTIALLHIVIIIIFIFVTTPNVVLSIMEKWSVIQPARAKEVSGYEGFLINQVSVLIQLITTALLPYLIILISRQIPYEDASSKSHSVMWKTYVFLVLMVIVMPSIGMSSAQALISSGFNTKCLFPTDNGAYFINYVISSLLLSTVLELLKPFDAIKYYFILWTGRSTADFEGGRRWIDREFSVGMQHTGVLLVFAVVMTYTISCPLIAPAGLLYMIVKHGVDHYHLYHTYFTKKVDRNHHTTIEVFVKVALMLMLFQTAVAITINTGTSSSALGSQIVFLITGALFVSNCFLYCASNKAKENQKKSRHQRDYCACFYLPRVIEDLLRANAVHEKFISRKV